MAFDGLGWIVWIEEGGKRIEGHPVGGALFFYGCGGDVDGALRLKPRC